jgi:hypothetical protein
LVEPDEFVVLGETIAD